VATCIALLFAVVAVLAIVEFVTSHNYFAALHAGNDAYGRWSTEQMRGGVPRVEGAFGHSIALGGSLALAVPFVWTSRFPAVLKGLILFLVGTAAVLTISRIGMGCTALAILLCLTALRKEVSKRFWGWTVGILTIGLLFAVPFATGVFAEAGQEAANSADYRGRITELIPQMDWIGESASSYRDASGATSHGAFQSIDSAMILTGLNIGILPTIVLLASAVGGIVALARGYRSASLVAIVAILPGLTSVAFITQFTTFFWFVVGLAVAQTVRVVRPHIGIPVQEPPGDQALVGGGRARRGDSIDVLPRAERS